MRRNAPAMASARSGPRVCSTSSAAAMARMACRLARESAHRTRMTVAAWSIRSARSW